MPPKTTAKPKNTEPVTPAPEQEPEAQLQPPEETDNDLQLVLKTKVKLDDTSLTLAGDTSFEEWREVYAFADKLNERGKFWLGDIVHYAEGKFPDRYTQAIEMTGLSYSRLTTLVSVCSRVDPSRRRREAPFHWHEKIAYLPYQTGDHLLDRAIKEKWTSEQLSDAVARAKGEPTAAEKKAAKEAKPGSTVAKVAASGKTPQIPEGEKPLIWNGYPLRVMLMLNSPRSRAILQGDEPLTTEEADKAAHHFNHAHGPALAAWLEEHNFIKAEHIGIIPITNEISAPLNGVDPNATESAPTPQDAEKPLPTNRCPWHREAQGQCKLPKDHEGACEFPPVEAPATPPASPEPPSVAAFLEMKEGMEQAIHARNEALELVERFKKERDFARSHIEAIGTVATSQANATPIQRAEEALRAFNIAVPEITDEQWAEIGSNKLLRLKWLENLLFTADEVIDKIQAHPIAVRK